MPMRFLITLFLVSSTFFACAQPAPQKWEARVVGISDGDTYEALLPDKSTVKIRMEGIDAPERNMPFYQVAKNYLSKLCFGKEVRIEKLDTDRYGRWIAKTYLPGKQVELGRMMIDAGYAWHFKKYSSDRELAEAEIQARKQKKGLWVDPDPLAPWEYRKAKKQSRQN